MGDHETGLARTLDPETSHAAARSVDATELESAVLRALRFWGPRTAAELAEYLLKPLNTVSPRTRPLVDKGLIRDSGKRRATPSGRKAIVWEAIGNIQGELKLEERVHSKPFLRPNLPIDQKETGGNV